MTRESPTSSGPSDLQLVAAANRGDAAAMEALYERHRDWVYSLARRVTGNRDDAADVLQEVFAYVFSKFPGFELTCRMRTFLYPAVRNTAVRIRDRRRRTRDIEEAAEPAARANRDPCAGEGGAVADLVIRLPEEQREIVLLRFAEDLALEEIAATLEIPLGTVKSRLHRALSELRRKLGG
jgi:RNA polymerase sigma-70 factor (ECF subfamily)